MNRPLIRRSRSSVPLSINGTLIAGVPDLRDDGRNSGISIPSQLPPQEIRTYNPPNRGQPDIRRAWNDQISARGLPNVDPNEGGIRRSIQFPGGLRLVNLSTTIPHNNVARMGLALPARPDRRRFILGNPDATSGGGGNTLYFSYQNNPNALLPIYSGQYIDESGSTISMDDIWVSGPTKGDLIVIYEGRLNGDYDP